MGTLALVVTIVGCSSTEEPAPTVTPAAERTASPTAAATREPTPGLTASPTPVSSPGPTPTAGPPTLTPLITATPEPARPVVVDEDAIYGGTLNLVSRSAIVHQDVHQELSPALSTWGPGIVYSRLMRFKSGRDVELPSLAVECELCERWEMEDERTLVFHLRDDARWQSIVPVDGREVTAGDIVYSYNRQRQLDWPAAGLLQGVRELRAPRPDLLLIVLTVPDADFMLSLADGHSKVVAKEAVDVHRHLKNGPAIGSGPWILEDSRPDTAHAFVRNPDYFETGLPYLEKLVIHVIPDPDTRAAAFASRIVDVREMDPREWVEFSQQNPSAPFLMAKEAGAGLEVALNTSATPFDDARVRRAAFWALDPWQSAQDLWLGAAYLSLGFPAVEAGWLLSERELREFFNRPDAARDLLLAVDGDRPVPVTIRVGDFDEPYISHARRIADELEAVGFAPTVEVVDRLTFGDRVWVRGDYQIFVGPIAPQSTPNGYLLHVLHSRGAWNTTGQRDDELDRLIEAQARETDPSVRRELVKSIQRRAFENAYRFLPATRVSIWTWSPRLRNFHPNFAGFEYSHWARVWVRE